MTRRQQYHLVYMTEVDVRKEHERQLAEATQAAQDGVPLDE